MRRITKYLNTRVIAVTGGIGSGQSTVCEHLKFLGCKVIDVDKKAKQIIEKDSNLQKELKKTFGENVFFSAGKLNRKFLADHAFKDEYSTLQLNKIVHPRMVAEVVEEMESARFSQKYPLIVIDAALIYELSIEQMFDVVIVVYAEVNERIKRVINRDKLSREEIMTRILRQIPLEEKREWADYVMDNNGSIENLKKQTSEIFQELLSDIKSAKRIRV